MNQNPLYCALDHMELNEALRLIENIKPYIGGVKVGLELFYKTGHKGLDHIRQSGLPLFLDLKLHDIPNTVCGALKALLHHKPDFTNLHIQGGTHMMKEASKLVKQTSPQTKLLGVGFLTSLSQNDLTKLGVSTNIENHILHLAHLAKQAGLDGVVAPHFMLPLLRQKMGKDFVLVCPGLRLEGEDTQDQKNVCTPKKAHLMGADILVLGRTLTGKKDPTSLAKTIFEGLNLVH